MRISDMTRTLLHQKDDNFFLHHCLPNITFYVYSLYFCVFLRQKYKRPLLHHFYTEHKVLRFTSSFLLSLLLCDNLFNHLYIVRDTFITFLLLKFTVATFPGSPVTSRWRQCVLRIRCLSSLCDGKYLFVRGEWLECMWNKREKKARKALNVGGIK